MEETDANAKKKLNPLRARNEQSRRKEELLNRFVSLLCSSVCPWLLRPARYLFLESFCVETSVLAVYQFEAPAFPLPAFVANTITDPQAITKVNSFHRIYI